jgi:hypothetical protein
MDKRGEKAEIRTSAQAAPVTAAERNHARRRRPIARAMIAAPQAPESGNKFAGTRCPALGRCNSRNGCEGGK